MKTLKISFAAVLLAATFTAGAAAQNEREVQFVQLDADSDGFVVLGEWTGGRETFEGLDRDGDAVLTRTEFFSKEVRRYTSREERFRELDSDHDGRVGASEWKWGEQTLSALDRNGDGFLSQDEFCRISRRAKAAKTTSAGK